MQILSQELSKTLQADSNNVSDQDIQDYYQRTANFEQATFVRIFVPHTKRIELRSGHKEGPGENRHRLLEDSRSGSQTRCQECSVPKSNRRLAKKQ